MHIETLAFEITKALGNGERQVTKSRFVIDRYNHARISCARGVDQTPLRTGTGQAAAQQSRSTQPTPPTAVPHDSSLRSLVFNLKQGYASE
ncbi:MAG: hypothetical protein U1D25_12050 [Hydrogenophaga sp.]|nr:hypothetical protein [Hydrogenophaga sp.]